MHNDFIKPFSESNFSVELRQEGGRIAIIIKTTEASLYGTTISDFDSLMVRLINNNSLLVMKHGRTQTIPFSKIMV